MLIVIKVGTSVLQDNEGRLDRGVIDSLCSQYNKLLSKGFQLIVVSSGAVGAGRSRFPKIGNRNPVIQQQIFAAIGQVELMSVYREVLSQYGIQVAQVLATKEDFRDRRHYLNMKNCLQGLLTEGVLPIVNENDVISLRELMFTDNDELAGLIAGMVDAQRLILLTNVEGILNGDPEQGEAEIIAEIKGRKALSSLAFPRKSRQGRGGMQSKLKVVGSMARQGIQSHIASGKRKHVLLDILIEKRAIGTLIRAEKKISPVKKWLATVDQTYGSLTINQGAIDAIVSDRASSVLPVGVVAATGRFDKGDVISVKSSAGEMLGLGLASYGSKQLERVMGKSNQKPVIHYNYLYLFDA